MAKKVKVRNKYDRPKGILKTSAVRLAKNEQIGEQRTDTECYMPAPEEIAEKCREIREKGWHDKGGDFHPPWLGFSDDEPEYFEEEAERLDTCLLGEPKYEVLRMVLRVNAIRERAKLHEPQPPRR